MRKFVNKNKKLILSLVFIIYLLVLGYHLFLSDILGRREISESYRYNLTLFKEITRYIENADVIGTRLVLVNIAGNIFAFVPFGIFVGCFLRRKKFAFIKTLLLGFLFTTAIEGIQLITRVGICDVDDIVLNLLGVIIGGILVKIFSPRINSLETKKSSGTMK